MSNGNHNLYAPGSEVAITTNGAEWRMAVPVIRQSVLKDFTCCRRKFLYQHVLGLVPKATKRSPACDTGDFWHQLMRVLYDTGGSVGEAVRMVEPVYRLVMDELGKLAAEDLSGEYERQAREVTASWHKAQVMAKLFWNRYPLSGAKVVECETPLAIRVGMDGPILQVTPDLLVEALDDGSLWIEDHKSSGDPPSAVMVGKAWAYQTNLYRFVVEMAKKMPVKGFIYNIMQTPGIKLCGTDEKEAKKTGVSPEEAYLKRVSDWYGEKPEETIKSAWIPAASLPPQSFSNFRTTTLAALIGVQALIDGRMDLLGFDQDATCYNCQRFGRTCEFLGLCESAPASWPGQLSVFYTQDFPVITTPIVEVQS
jgi:hypothetical protein